MSATRPVGVEKVTRYACAEAGGEEPYEKREKDTVLKCHINEKTAHLPPRRFLEGS